MSEKRFEEQNLENHLNRIYDTKKGNVVFDEDIVDLLNELAEEKELWKRECKRLKGLYYLENKDNNYIIQDLQNEDEYQLGFVNCDEDVFLELINQLSDENEQLKQLLDYADDLIQSYMSVHNRDEWENVKKNITGDVE